MRKLLVLSFGGLIALSSQLSANEYSISNTDIRYIYDGDTYYVNCIDGLKCNKNKLGIRPPYIDTPEMKSDCQAEREHARKAKQAAVAFLRSSETLRLVVNPQRPYGHFGRLIATTHSEHGQLSNVLLRKKLARPYNRREGKRPWCDKDGNLIP